MSGDRACITRALGDLPERLFAAVLLATLVAAVAAAFHRPAPTVITADNVWTVILIRHPEMTCSLSAGGIAATKE